MMSDVIKLCDKNFFIGYILPVLLFVTVNALIFVIYCPGLLLYMGLSEEQLQEVLSPQSLRLIITQFQNIWTFFIISLVLLSSSTLLLILNRELIRFLEGYYVLNRPFLKCIPPKRGQIKKFRHIIDEIKMVEYSASQEDNDRYMGLMKTLSKKFPYEEEHVLPTSFGNRIRAFEVYTNKVYGFDAIPIWPRITLILPDDAKKNLNSAKAQVDFAVNCIVLSTITLVIYFTLAFVNSKIIASFR